RPLLVRQADDPRQDARTGPIRGRAPEARHRLFDRPGGNGEDLPRGRGRGPRPEVAPGGADPARPALGRGGRKPRLPPGDMKDKVDPYLRPLYDALNDLLSYEKIRRFL